MSINNNDISDLRQRLNLTSPSGEHLFLTQLSTGAVLCAEGTDNSIDIIGEETDPNNPAIRLMSGTTPILNIHSGKLECYNRLYMNNNPIYVGALDTNHSIVYSSYNMDGVQISGFGDSNTPFFRVRSSNGDVYVIEATTNKVNIYKDLFLEYHLNVSGSTRLGDNVRVDNLTYNQAYLDLYTGDTTGPEDSLHNHNSKIRFFRTSIERAAVAYYAGGDSILIYNKEGDIALAAHSTGAEGGRIELKSNGTIELKSVSNNTIFSAYNDKVDISQILNVSTSGINNSTNLNLKVNDVNAISLFTNTIDIFKNTDFNQNILYLKGGGNVNHYIRFRDIANTINGPRISGYGGSGRAVFDVVSQATTADEVLFNILNEKINMYKPLYMNSTTATGEDRPIYLHDDENFYIKYQNSSSAGSPNVTEIKGYEGVHLGSSANTSMNLKVEQDRVEITKMKAIDYINLESNAEIRIRAHDDPWQVATWKGESETIGGSGINIDGWFIRGWNGGRLASVKGIYPPFESNNVHHAVWYMSGSDARFGGPFGYNNYSDDRIKFEETTITNALQTIMKLNPVLYKKGKYIGDTDYSSMKLETGFVAQEVYNNVPEMRHLVDFDKSLPRNFVDGDLTGNCVENIYSRKTNSDGITEEKPEVCTVCYDEVIPFTVKAIQELNALVNTLQSTVNNLNQQLESQALIINDLQSKIA